MWVPVAVLPSPQSLRGDAARLGWRREPSGPPGVLAGFAEAPPGQDPSLFLWRLVGRVRCLLKSLEAPATCRAPGWDAGSVGSGPHPRGPNSSAVTLNKGVFPVLVISCGQTVKRGRARVQVHETDAPRLGRFQRDEPLSLDASPAGLATPLSRPRPSGAVSKGSVFPSLGCGVGPTSQDVGRGVPPGPPSLPLHQPPDSHLPGSPPPVGTLAVLPRRLPRLSLWGREHCPSFPSRSRHPQLLICHQTVRSRAKVTYAPLAKRALVNTWGGRSRCCRAGTARSSAVYLFAPSVSPWVEPPRAGLEDQSLPDRAGGHSDSQELKMHGFGKAVHPPGCVITSSLPLIWLCAVITRVLSNRLAARPREIPSGDAIGQNNSTCFPLNKSSVCRRSSA